MKKSSPRKRRPAKTRRKDFYRLRLYIAGQTPNSVTAIANLKKICEDKLRGKYRDRSSRFAGEAATGQGRSDHRHSDPGKKAPAAGQENHWEPLQDRECHCGVGSSAATLKKGLK